MHGAFYPACRTKCGPVLPFLLRGLDVEPRRAWRSTPSQYETLHEDAHLAVLAKPAGLLSVPGKEERDSVLERLKAKHPHAMLVHRLDLDTSGVLLAALDADTYRALQAQWHEVEKRYVAFAITGGLGNLFFGSLILLHAPTSSDEAARLAGVAFVGAAILSWTAVLSLRLVRFGGPARDRAQLRRISSQALPSLGAGMLTVGMSVVDQIYTMPLGEGSYATLTFAQRWPMFATQLPALALGTVADKTLTCKAH